MRHEELRRLVNQLLQLRPAAIGRFEQIAATGELQAVYYDLSNGVTPALFVVVAGDGEDRTEVIRLQEHVGAPAGELKQLSAAEIEHLTEAVTSATNSIDLHPAWCTAKHQTGPGTGLPPLPYHSAVALLRDRLLARSMLLTRGTQRARADGNTYVIVLCVRAHLETTGTLAQLVLKLTRLRAGKLDAKQWKDALRRLTAGAKTDLDDEIAIEPFNVLTLVDAIADALALAGVSEKSEFRESYEISSEWAHPNSGGTAIDWHNGAPESLELVNAAQWTTLGSSIEAFETLTSYLDEIL